MQFRNLSTGEVLDLNSSDSRLAIDNPNLAPISEQIMAKSSDGEKFTLTPAQFKEAKDQGADIELHTEVDEAKDEFKGLGGGILAAGAGALSGATLGLSDLALTKTGLVKPSTLEGLKEAHPIANVAGELAGTVGTALIPGVNVALGAKLAGTGAKAIAKRAIAGGVTTGLQQSLSAEAVRETPFAVERLAKDFATNAIIGSLAGAGLEGALKLATKATPIAKLIPGIGLSDADAAIWNKVSALERGDEVGRKAIIDQLSTSGKAQLWMNDKHAKLSSLVIGGDSEALTDMLTSRQFRDNLRDKSKSLVKDIDVSAVNANINQIKDKASKDYQDMLVNKIKQSLAGEGKDQLKEDLINPSLFHTAADLLANPETEGLYSKEMRKGIEETSDYAEALQSQWGKASTLNPDIIAEGVIALRHQINNTKQLYKTARLAGKTTVDDAKLLDALKADSDTMVETLGGVDVFKAEKTWSQWKSLQKTLKTISDKDSGKILPRKLDLLLKNKDRFNEFNEALVNLSELDNSALSESLAGMRNRLEKYRDARSLTAKQGREGILGTLGSIGLGVGTGPVIGAASLLLTNPALYLRALDATKDKVALPLASLVTKGASNIAVRSPVDKFAERLVNDWRKKGQYEEFIASLDPVQAQLAVSNDPNYQSQPELAQQVAEKTGQVYNTLQQKAPKLLPSVLNPGQSNRPSDEELRRYSRVVSAVLFPEEAVKRAQFNKEYADSLAGVFDEHLKLLNNNPSTIPGQELAGTQRLQEVLYSNPTQPTGGKPNTGGKITVPTTSTYRVGAK